MPTTSYATVMAENFLNFFVGRQLSPGSTFFDDLPFSFGNVIVLAPPFKPPQESSHFLLTPPAARSTPDQEFLSLDPLSWRHHTIPFQKVPPGFGTKLARFAEPERLASLPRLIEVL